MSDHTRQRRPVCRHLVYREPFQPRFDNAYVFMEDGYHIREVATGRTFHRDLWSTRGR